MNKLKELEKRLREEPDNLGLRVMVAGALHEAGRLDDAVELYRSVAIAYREQGRLQQAIMVCRSILEIAPDDASCQALLAMMVASRAAPLDTAPPGQRSALPPRPPPSPLPDHLADATTSSLQRLSRAGVPPSVEHELDTYPEISGIASAARQISESLIAASRQRDEDDDVSLELDTRRIPRGPRISTTEPDTIAGRSPPELDDRAGADGTDDDDPTLTRPRRGGTSRR